MSAVLSPRYCNANVSMSVSVQCLCTDVEGNDVPTIWCIRLSMVVLSAVCKCSAGVNVMSTKLVKSTTVSKVCTCSQSSSLTGE